MWAVFFIVVVFHFFPIMPLAEIKYYSFNIVVAHFIDCPLCKRSSSRYRLPNSGKINRKGGGYSVGLCGWTNILQEICEVVVRVRPAFIFTPF